MQPRSADYAVLLNKYGSHKHGVGMQHEPKLFNNKESDDGLWVPHRSPHFVKLDAFFCALP